MDKKTYARARIPKRFWGKALTDYDLKRGDEEAADAISEYLEELEERLDAGVGMTLVGAPGGGKTLLGSIILISALHLGHSAQFRTLASYVHLLQKRIELSKVCGGEYASGRDYDDYEAARTEIDNLLNVYQFVYLDDVGKEHLTSTEWAQREFDFLLRSRFDKGLVTILSSNVPIRNWSSTYGAAMESFIHEACPIVAVVPDEDYRKKRS